MNKEVIRVENPAYMTLEQIKEQFRDNFVLVTNTMDSPAGIVRFYCQNNVPELTDIIMEFDKNTEQYGDCKIYYVGPGRGFMGVYL